MKKFFKKFWWVLLIALLLIGGGVYFAVKGLPQADKSGNEVADTTPAPTDPFDLDLTKDLAFNLDVIKRYLADDEWALRRLSVYKDYLDQYADELNDDQRPVYDQLLANYHFRNRLNNGQRNEPAGDALTDLLYDLNLYERGDLLVSMADSESDKRFADFYEQYQTELADMHFSAINDAWNNTEVAEEPKPETTDSERRAVRKPKEKEVVETPSQKLLKALRNYSPQTPEATIREQVSLGRYPNYEADLQRLSRAVQNERNEAANHRASRYENCLMGAEDFEDLLIRYGI